MGRHHITFVGVLTGMISGACIAGIGLWLAFYLSDARGWASVVAAFGFLGGGLVGAIIGGIIGAMRVTKRGGAAVGAALGILPAVGLISGPLSPNPLLGIVKVVLFGMVVGVIVAYVVGRQPAA
jgi:hypothetical protein